MENLSFSFDFFDGLVAKRPDRLSKRALEKLDYVNGLIPDAELAKHIAQNIRGPNPNYIVCFDCADLDNASWAQCLNCAKQKLIDSAIADYVFASVDVLQTTINNPASAKWVTICSNGLYAAGYAAPELLDYSEPKPFKAGKKDDLAKKQKLVTFIFEGLRNKVIDMAA
ncbi:hypothetical protein [Endozoicomonas sp. GU-1]|uniref:hypothetical protein n=1 Tax=Endozoicomonas sp. GU-1 TaxID=3009078 RepID=UPI0022B40872|nr:hypothetical protein [Endozoicomonas sp. GU-1]WBA79592.1 hypothetical protein O2T12_14505 [Endozoicomonas sp. GU-1]